MYPKKFYIGETQTKQHQNVNRIIERKDRYTKNSNEFFLFILQPTCISIKFYQTCRENAKIQLSRL